MPEIKLLPKSVSELIAAGEVVERPASVVKETVENSVDAGSKHITVEIKNGGISFIRITDDGCGISANDVKTAFLRHATSKIRSGNDLDAIKTLGFRGEALAAISSVSKTEIFTKTAEAQFGTHYVISGGEEKEFAECGCPDGTTLIVRDLFYNTPARMKFLKKDSSEGTAVGAVVERIALSHPEISFKFIREGKQIFATSGDGKISSAVYAVLGREFYSGLIEVKGESDGVSVSGFTCKPVFCRASRAMQFIFLNGRLVLSKTVMAAAEQAYKDSAMVGKFPAFVLFVGVPYETVDVNVHPAKTEVRFADEKRVFSAVYYAVKSAISAGDTRPQINISKPQNNTVFKMTAQEYRQTAVNLPKNEEVKTYGVFKQDTTPLFLREDVKKYINEKPRKVEDIIDIEPESREIISAPEVFENIQPPPTEETEEYSPKEEVVFIGEAFRTYIVVSKGDEIYLIDKHAAHERIIYNRLKAQQKPQTQALLQTVTVKLSPDAHHAAVTMADVMNKAGFEIEDFGQSSVLVRAVPASLSKEDVSAAVTEAAESLAKSGQVEISALDNIYHSIACKAAIKAGYITSEEELLSLAQKVLSDKDVMYCPHGRPVAFLIKKYDLEKYFGRIQ